MKRLFLLIALLVLASPAFAVTETTSTIGDRNSSGEYRAKTTFDGTSGVYTFASDTGIVYPYLAYTTVPTTVGVTLIAAQSGITISDTGGGSPTTVGSCRKFTLPTAAPGLEFTFTTGSKCTMTVDTADTNDTIMYSISGTGLDAGDSIKSTAQAGDSVTLFSTAANKWFVKQMKATWTDNSTN